MGITGTMEALHKISSFYNIPLDELLKTCDLNTRHMSEGRDMKSTLELIIYDGKKYLFDEDLNVIYNFKTRKQVGTMCKSSQDLIFFK